MNYSQIIDGLLNDPDARHEACRGSLELFTAIYLNRCIKDKIPPFHRDIYRLLSDWKYTAKESGRPDARILELVAFRGAAKSTIASLALPLWNAVYGNKQFIVIVSDTHAQAKMLITNLIAELETNELIRADFGDQVNKDEDEWTATNVVLANGVRIMARSRGQKIRGLRHRENRPDLVVLDDIENSEDVRTLEQRDKTDDWIWGDVYPAVAADGLIVVVGSLLHDDGIMARLKRKIAAGHIGVFREYPLLSGGDVEGASVWPEAYPPERIEQIKKSMRPSQFLREYLGRVVPDEGQLVKRVGYYDALPKLVSIALGVDLAISQKASADETAMNSAGRGEDGKIYNLTNTAGHWNFNETLANVHAQYLFLRETYPDAMIRVGIEDVAYQAAAIEEAIRRFEMPVEAIKQTKDKRARLETYVPYLENDQIVFRREGQDELIGQITGFGVERRDDRSDSAEIAWRILIEEPRAEIAWS